MSSDAIQKRDPFLPSSMVEAERFSAILAKSPLMPEALRGKPGDVLVILIAGHELGLSPMQAIRGINVIKGKVAMSADLSVALVKKHPECVFFRLVESSDAVATYETQRKGEPQPTKMSFTIQQAQQAGLSGQNWKAYPAAMLRARCSQALARAVYPDLMLGVYDPEEIAPAPERPAKPLQVVRSEPVDAEIVQASTAGDAFPPDDVPSMPLEPSGIPGELSAAEKAVALIAEAQDLKGLATLTQKILEMGVSKDEAVRKAYAARQGELKKVAGSP